MSDPRRADEPHPDLAGRCEQLEREIERLRSLLNQHGIAIPGIATKPLPAPSSLKAPEKVALFRSLFRGREDVYAQRWESPDSRVGYSPSKERAERRTMPPSRTIESASTKRRKKHPARRRSESRPSFRQAHSRRVSATASMTLAGSLWWISTRGTGRTTLRHDAAAFRETWNTLGVPGCSPIGQRSAHLDLLRPARSGRIGLWPRIPVTHQDDGASTSNWTRFL